MAKSSEPIWWERLDPPDADYRIESLSWLRSALDDLKKISSPPEKATWKVVLDYSVDAQRLAYVRLALNAAEICQQLSRDDLAPVCRILKVVMSKKSDLNDGELQRLLSLILGIERLELDETPCAEAVAACDETAEAGGVFYVATDQVRFTRLDGDADPIPLADVPPIVFSEIMRDVDLFVGVCSVGNDPSWHDGGPRGTHARYWHDYAFGELTASAATRKEVLERLIPRLKIADRCSFDSRFLVVRGELKTYKIHLGSGNILMSPNDQYLCIVPQRADDHPETIFLPFEGDRTLSVILSKALLLADDARITDASIVGQIRS